MTPEARITALYGAFQRRDGPAMAACYAPDARFSDPVFPDLDAREAGAMWRMFCGRPGSDLVVTFRDVRASGDEGTAHWDATYTFPATGRKVHNSIDAHFTLRDGLIVRHVDRFDLWRWAGMALGPTGLVLGWSPLVQNRIRARARAQLDAFLGREHTAEARGAD
jgi:ketosteroid isomerase-like protein